MAGSEIALTEKQETLLLAGISVAKPSLKAENGNKIRLTLSIGGMTCSVCSGAIEKALRVVEGIDEMLSMTINNI